MYTITYVDSTQTQHLTAQSAQRKFKSCDNASMITRIWSRRYGIISPFELTEFVRLERAERAHNRKELSTFR